MTIALVRLSKQSPVCQKLFLICSRNLCGELVIMIARQGLTCLIVLGFVADVWSHVEIEAEDYFFPLEPVINYCKMADLCQHDFVEVCGQDSKGQTQIFKDNCDLYEFNCDDKKQFHHVSLDVCPPTTKKPPKL